MKKIIVLVFILAVFFSVGYFFYTDKKESLTYEQLYRSDDLLFINFPDIAKNIELWKEHSIFQHLLHFEGLNSLSNDIDSLAQQIELDVDANLALIVEKDGELLLVAENEGDFTFFQSIFSPKTYLQKEVNGRIWFILRTKNLLLASTKESVLEREIEQVEKLDVNWNHLFVRINAEALAIKLEVNKTSINSVFSLFNDFSYTLNLYDNKLVSSGYSDQLNALEIKSLSDQKAVNFDLKDLLIINYNKLSIFQFDDGLTYVQENKLSCEPEALYNTRFAEVSFFGSDKKETIVYLLKTEETDALIKTFIGNQESSIGRFQVYALENTKCLDVLFPALKVQDVNYVAIFNNQAIFSMDKSSVEFYTNRIIEGDVWSNSNEQMKWVEDEFIAFNILKINKLNNVFSHFKDSSIVGGYYIKNQKQFDKLPLLLLQKSLEKTGVYSALTLDLMEKSSQQYDFQSELSQNLKLQETTEPSTFVSLPKGLISYPKAVKNYATGKFQFMVQDEDYMLYMLSNTGKIDWKIKLESEINSEIFEVDIFKNNKIQYLFSTGKKVYCLDRLGRLVTNFPFGLPKKALISNLNVIDYKQSKDYRIAITSGKNIWLYNKDAKALTSWNPLQFKTNVIGKLEHIRLDNIDYLQALEKDGKIHLLQRKGVAYDGFPVSEGTEFLGGQSVFVKGNNELSSTLTFLENDGIAKRINLKGQLLFSEKLPVSSKIDTVILDQKNTLIRYAAFSEKKVYVFDNKLGKRLEHSTVESELVDFQVYELSGQEVYIFIYSNRSELVLGDGTVILDKIPTHKKVSVFYSPMTKSGELFYTNNNKVEKIGFSLGR